MSSYQQPPMPQPPMPQPAMAQPAMPQPPMPQPAMAQPAMAQPAMAQPAMAQPGVMPQVHAVDETAATAAFAVTGGSGGGIFPQYIKVLGPAGQTKWDHTVPVKFEGAALIRLCPPSGPGKPVFLEIKTHFYKSIQHPKGAVVGFTGEDGLFMEAVRMAMKSNDPRLQQLATDFGKVRRQVVWNALDLGNPQSHMCEDGVMRPFLLGAGSQLQADLKRLSEARGGVNALVNPESGRIIRVTKKKTGPEERNVEYGALDLDPSPLDPFYFPILGSLWDLEDQIKIPTHEELIAVIQEIGFPIPVTGQSVGQVPASYSAAPNPPGANPYAQQPVVAQPPMPQPAMAQPPMPQPAMAQPPMPQPPMAQPPMPQPAMAQPAMAQPAMAQPAMAPPPVTSAPGVVPAVPGNVPF